MMMLKNVLSELADKYRLDLTVDDNKAVLSDPKTGEQIDVYEEKYYPKKYFSTGSEDDVYVQYIVCFSTQHVHIDDLSEVPEYIESILTDEVLPIEFYLNGERRFGGEIKRADFDGLSAKFLAAYYGYSVEDISRYEYEIHSWCGRYNTGRKRIE